MPPSFLPPEPSDRVLELLDTLMLGANDLQQLLHES